MAASSKRDLNRFAAISYLGSQGSSAACKHAMIGIVQQGSRIESAQLLTCGTTHCFLLTLSEGHFVAIKSGFASGYVGQAPATLAYALTLLDAIGVDIIEYDVDRDFIERLDASALTREDLRALDERQAVHGRWPDYVRDIDWQRVDSGAIWRDFPPVIPFAILDRRILDLAVSFWVEPDARLLTAYRRLEDGVRGRTGIDAHGARLFSQAFTGANPKLRWPETDDAIQGARAQLFSAAYTAYRNTRAHRERDERRGDQLAEFLLVNELYRLESLAEIGAESDAPPPNGG